MKTKTSLLAICLLVTAGAVGKPERVSEAPVLDMSSVQNAGFVGADVAAVQDQTLDTKWRYPASTYVAPKVPI